MFVTKWKHITLMLVAHFLCATALAQEKPRDYRKFNGGLEIGFTASKFSKRIGEFGAGNPSEYDETFRAGATIGLHSRLQISRGFALRPELIINGRGGSYRNENTGVVSIGSQGSEKNYYYKNYRVTYAEIPLLIEIDFTGNLDPEDFHFRIAGGMSYGMLLGSVLRYNGYTPTGSGPGPLTEVKEDYQVVEFDYARKSVANAIAEMSFEFTNGLGTPMFIRIRYNGSLTPVYDSIEENSYNMKTKMSTFSLVFGLYFAKHN